jgi:hypothetical protein
VRLGTAALAVGIATCAVGAGYLVDLAKKGQDTRFVAACLGAAVLLTATQTLHQARLKATDPTSRRRAVFRTTRHGWAIPLLIAMAIGAVFYLRANGTVLGWTPFRPTDAKHVNQARVWGAILASAPLWLAFVRYRQSRANYLKITKDHLVRSWQRQISSVSLGSSPKRFTLLWSDIESIWIANHCLMIKLSAFAPNVQRPRGIYLSYKGGETMTLLDRDEIDDLVRLYQALSRLAGSRYFQVESSP